MTRITKIDPDRLFVRLLISRKYRPLRHTLLILGVLTLGIGNFYTEYPENNLFWQLLVILLVMIPILSNVYILVPRLLLKNRPYLYFLSVIALIATVLALNTAIQFRNQTLIRGVYSADYGSVSKYIFLNNISTAISFSLIIAGTTAVIILQLWLRDRERIEALEKASVQAELEMLKNQINPHFLFNMLNNAIVLTREDPAYAREVILKLRDMLNYQLEKSLAEKILLRDDIAFLSDLLALEKLRRDSFLYDIRIDGDTEHIRVPPLLFIPFVENAIKHGNDNTGQSDIELEFSVNDNRLTFCCNNSVPAYTRTREQGGIGLRNIRRRLELIYAKDYRLDIRTDPGHYDVTLTIPL